MTRFRKTELKYLKQKVEPEAGIGPATYALRVRCSTTELPGRVAHSTDLMREKLLQLQRSRQRAEWWTPEQQRMKREIFVCV